jgi:hypothetical protein
LPAPLLGQVLGGLYIIVADPWFPVTIYDHLKGTKSARLLIARNLHVTAMVSISENQFFLSYEMFQDLLHPEGGNPQLVRENFHQSVRPLTMIISSMDHFYDPLLNLVGLAHYLHLPWPWSLFSGLRVSRWHEFSSFVQVISFWCGCSGKTPHTPALHRLHFAIAVPAFCEPTFNVR